MNTKKMLCSKCQGEMEQGFVPDYAHGGTRRIWHWHVGRPKKSFWMGTKEPWTPGIPIAAFRCQKCGFTELYSNAELEAE